MTVAQARSLVRQFARNAGSSDNYTDADVDRALQLVCARFTRKTRYTKVKSDLTLTANSSALPTFPTGFLPECLISAWLRSTASRAPVLDIVSNEQLLADAVDASTGFPVEIAFSSTTTGAVWPTPAGNYAMSFQWWKPFTLWTAGSDPTVVLDLPDAVLVEILPYGPPAVLQHNEPEHAYATTAWQKYLEVEEGMRGAGTLSGRVVQVDRPW